MAKTYHSAIIIIIIIIIWTTSMSSRKFCNLEQVLATGFQHKV